MSKLISFLFISLLILTSCTSNSRPAGQEEYLDLIANVDGEVFTIYGDFERDNGYVGKIWEWCDEPVLGNITDFIRAVCNASNVKFKMNGDQYYDTRTLTKAQINSIKQTVELFEAMGGEL